MKTLRKFMEDASSAITNTAGAGFIAGIGVGDQGEPGIPGRLFRRKDEDEELNEDMFAGAKVFDVDPDVFHKCRLGKIRYHRWSKYVGDSPIGQQIRAYGIANPKKAIIIRNRMNGNMMFLRHSLFDQIRQKRCATIES